MNIFRACLAGLVTLCFIASLGHSLTIPQTSIGANELTADISGTDLKDLGIPSHEANAFTQQHLEGAYDEYVKNNQNHPDYKNIRHKRENSEALYPIDPGFDPEYIPKSRYLENFIATHTDDKILGIPLDSSVECDSIAFKNICSKVVNNMSFINSNPKKITPKRLLKTLQAFESGVDKLYEKFISNINCNMPNECQYIESIVHDLSSINIYADKIIKGELGFEDNIKGIQMSKYASDIQYMSNLLLKQITENTHLCDLKNDCHSLKDSDLKDGIKNPLCQRPQSKPTPKFNRKCNPFNTFKTVCKDITDDSIFIQHSLDTPTLKSRELVSKIEKISNELRSGVNRLYKDTEKFKNCLTLNLCDGVETLSYDLNVLLHRVSLKLTDIEKIKRPKIRERGLKACKSIIELSKFVIQAISQENSKCLKLNDKTSLFQDVGLGHAGKQFTDSDITRIKRSLSVDSNALRHNDINPMDLQDFSIEEDNNSDEVGYANSLDSDIDDDAVYHSDYDNDLSDISDNDADKHEFDRSSIPCTDNCPP